jgi:hypothetical protein
LKKFIYLLFIIALVFVVWNKQRLFLRDPMAKVVSNGVNQQHTQVFINYSNDVLLEKDTAPMSILLAQHGGRIGMPPMLKCVHFLVCLTDADVATLITVDEGSTVESMSGKSVVFKNFKGNETVVTLH